jgi:hypothetical protein
MYGVPTDLPVDAFVGREFNQICLGRFQLQFHASGTGSISVEGRWELRDDAQTLVDGEQDHAERKTFRLHPVIDVPITRVSIDPPKAFSIFFENGWTLTIFDDSPQYEAFSIHLDGQTSVYI